MMKHVDLVECQELLRGGSRSFHAASLVLPLCIREPAAAVYAFCRLSDDAVDGSSDPAKALDEWRDRLDRIYRGVPIDCAADRAFASVVQEYAIPRVLPESLLEGYEWDAQGRRYETLDEVVDYSVRVAGTVGGMMTLLMGPRDTDTLSRAVELGIAMQLSNIARDVGEDARNGRIYLPLGWLRSAGIDPEEFLANPVYTPALGQVTKRLLNSAQSLYDRAPSGIASLPTSCRFGIHAARLLYAEIGSQVERNNLDSVSQRAVVSPQRKLAIVAQASIAAMLPAQSLSIPAVPEAQYLIDAVVAAPPPARPVTRRPVPWWQFRTRLIWVIDLFTQLEQRAALNQMKP